MDRLSPSNLGSKRPDPPMAAHQSDNFLPSSRLSVKKAIKIIKTLTPMRAFSKVLDCHKLDDRLKDLHPVLSGDCGISCPAFSVCKYRSRATALGGQLWLKAQSQKSFEDCWKTGWLPQLVPYSQAAEVSVWPPGPPTLPQNDRRLGNRWLPELLVGCPLVASCYYCPHFRHCWKSHSGGPS